MDVFFPLANWDFLLVATSEGNPTHRIIVPKTIPNETLPPTSRTGAERLDVNLRLDTVRGLKFPAGLWFS